MDIFCVKCKRGTSTNGEKIIKINNRSRVTGTCSVCGIRKNRFIKNS